MEVSVVVPVLNEAKYLRTCLVALDNQSFPRELFEIIVVENGSVDGSQQLAEAWPGVKLLHEPIRDPYLARNRGIRAAKGRTIAFTDADCQVAPNWLEELDIALSDEEVNVAVGRLATPQDRTFWLQLYSDYYDTKTKRVFELPLANCLFGHGGNMAVRSDAFEKWGLFEPMPCVGDTEFVHRVLEQGAGLQTVRYVEDAVVTHLETRTLRELLPKLESYGTYSAAVTESTHRFRTLTIGERMQMMWHCASEHGYGPLQFAGLGLVLARGLLSFERGRFAYRPDSAK